MKNVAILIPSLSGGGAERVAGNISKGLSEKYNVYIILYNKNDVTYEYGGQLLSLDEKLYNNPVGKLYGMIKKIFKLRSMKKELKIDLTISFLDNVNIINILSKTNDKIVISERNFRSKEKKSFYNRILGNLVKVLYNKADKIVACSQVIREDLIENFNVEADKVTTIYNPYDINKIKKLSLEAIENESIDKPYIINVGRLTFQKGQKHLINAFKIVKDKIDNIDLVIAGQGELEEELKQQVSTLGLNESVHFLGFESNPFKYVAKSEIFVLSSLFEGFPNCLLEAMVCGAPIIATDCKSGPREILTDNYKEFNIEMNFKEEKYGIIVPDFSNNISIEQKELELANAIIKVLENSEIKKKYIGMSNERHKEFSLENICSQFDSIIKELT